MPITNPSNPTCLASGGWVHFGDRLIDNSDRSLMECAPAISMGGSPSGWHGSWGTGPQTCFCLTLIRVFKEFRLTHIYTSNDLNLQSWTKERPWPSQIVSCMLQRNLHKLRDMTNPSQLERHPKNGYVSVIVQGTNKVPGSSR